MGPRTSRISRQSVSYTPVQTLEHDGIAISLQEALGARVLLIRVIGEGGMGRVYLGRDPQLKRFVAVKVLVQAGADVEAHARFQREAQAIAAVSHPNVVAIYGVGDLPDGTPYFVMQYISGGSMADRLARTGPLGLEQAESVIGDVAAALAAAHKRGIVHRDVKAANVLWDEDSERAAVSDFGVAGLLSDIDDESAIRITQGGMTLGSPAYMSPEQLLAEPMTAKSDIYALGLLGYELLTGRGPYNAVTPAAVAAAHLSEEPRRLSDLRRDVPPVLDAVLLRCLAKDAADRPTAEEVTTALTPGAADVLEWPPPGLERARGALWRLMTLPTLSALSLILPLLVMLQFGQTSLLQGTIVWQIVLGVSALFGFFAFVGAAWRAWRVAHVLDTAARLVYGWGTLAEVVADRRGDTGALIAGTREYGVLSPDIRSLFRWLRVASAVTLASGPPLALAAAVLALSFRGNTDSGASYFISAVVWTTVITATLGVLCAVPETVRLSMTRSKRGVPARKSDMELAPAWYAAFDRSREGQALGAGRPVHRVLAIVAASLCVLAVVYCAAVMLIVTLLTFTGQSISNVIGAPTSSWLAFASQRNSGARSYRSPPDGVTSPTDAGEALLNISATYRTRTPSPIERPPRTNYPHWTRVLPPESMFEHGPDQGWTDGAILTAAKGLTPEQRALLMRAAAHPARDELVRASHASSVDVFGALLRLPMSQPLHPSEFPGTPIPGIEDVMESQAANVAIAVADRRYADAERSAREMIAVSSMVMDMPFNVNVLMGFRMLQHATRTLEAVYVASGREHDARVLMDSVAAGATRSGRAPAILTASDLHEVIRSSRFARGVRMEMILPILVNACADPRQLLFGPDAETKRDMAYVRDSLARYPSERLWIESLASAINGDIAPPPSTLQDAGMLAHLPAMVPGIVGGHRLVNCVVASPIYSLRR